MSDGHIEQVGTPDEVYENPTTAFVAKFLPDGSGLVYSTYLGGTGSDSGNGIDVDSGGHAYVVGFAGSMNFPTTPSLRNISVTVRTRSVAVHPS